MMHVVRRNSALRWWIAYWTRLFPLARFLVLCAGTMPMPVSPRTGDTDTRSSERAHVDRNGFFFLEHSVRVEFAGFVIIKLGLRTA